MKIPQAVLEWDKRDGVEFGNGGVKAVIQKMVNKRGSVAASTTVRAVQLKQTRLVLQGSGQLNESDQTGMGCGEIILSGALQC